MRPGYSPTRSPQPPTPNPHPLHRPGSARRPPGHRRERRTLLSPLLGGAANRKSKQNNTCRSACSIRHVDGLRWPCMSDTPSQPPVFSTKGRVGYRRGAPEVDSKTQLHYTIHQLHHTVGSTLIRELLEQIVSRMLGHRDSRSTWRYAEVNEDQVQAALVARHRGDTIGNCSDRQENLPYRRVSGYRCLRRSPDRAPGSPDPLQLQLQVIRQDRGTTLILPECVAAPMKLRVAAHELRMGVLPVAIALQQSLAMR
jgi:hypothetical protein